MISGHIDFVSRNRVEGWIFSEKLPLAGQTVLAFVDETCVGGGRVELFRRDLLDAGLGDGMVGFGFPVDIGPDQDPRVLDIRLEGGPMRLVQGAACVAPRDQVGEDRRRQGRDRESLAFMRARGWLDDAQFAALGVLGEFGVHVQALRLEQRRRGLDALAEEVALAAGQLMELHMLSPIAVEIRDGVTPAGLPAIRRELRAAFPFVPPVIGLWAPTRQYLSVVEGSHLDTSADASAAGGVEYAFGERHLLMLDLDARRSVPGERPLVFTAFVPAPVET